MNFISAHSPRTFLSFIFAIFSFFIHPTPEQKGRPFVENRECRLIFLLERAGKQKARLLSEKAGTIPEMGKC
jgi:hypothetical protein